MLEVGGGEGALTAELAPQVATVHVVELDDRMRPALERVAAAHGNVELHFGDAMRLDLAGLDPPPDRMVANLPYSIATPLIVRTIAELDGLDRWTLMVQREIADRLRAGPGSRLYGSPSVLVQLACEVRLLRTVDRAVFTPRPRVDSALSAPRSHGTGRGARGGRPRQGCVRAPPQVAGALARACAAGHARRGPGGARAARPARGCARRAARTAAVRGAGEGARELVPRPPMHTRSGGCKPSPGGVLSRPGSAATRAPCVLAMLGFRAPESSVHHWTRH